MLNYVKKNGTKVQINDQEENVKAAKALGWKEEKKEEPKKEEKKPAKAK